MLLTIVMFLPNVGGMKANAATTSDWKHLYSAYLDKIYKDMDSYEAALIYVDNDNVPELYVKSVDQTFLANDVCILLTINKNKVNKCDVSNEKFLYAKKKNRVYYHLSQGGGSVDYSQMSKLQSGRLKNIWTAMADIDLTVPGGNTYEYEVNVNVTSNEKYKNFIKKETSKCKWKNVNKELKSLKIIVKTKLTSSKLKNLICYSTYNTAGSDIDDEQITKAELTQTTLTVWGSFYGRDVKGNIKIYKAQKRTFVLASNVKYSASGAEGMQYTEDSVLSMLNFSGINCGISFKTNSEGKVTSVDLYL